MPNPASVAAHNILDYILSVPALRGSHHLYGAEEIAHIETIIGRAFWQSTSEPKQA